MNRLFLPSGFLVLLLVSFYLLPCSAGPAEDVESARVLLRKFQETGDPAALQSIDNNYLSGKWQMRSEATPQELLQPGPALIAEFHQIFNLGMEIFSAIDAHDAVLAAQYTEDDEFSMQKNYPVSQLLKVIPRADYGRFDPSRLDLLDASLITDDAVREGFLRSRERYFHAESIKKQRRELDSQYNSWRSRLESIIKLTPETDRSKLIDAVIKNVKREEIRALLIPGYLPAAKKNETGTPKASPAQPIKAVVSATMSKPPASEKNTAPPADKMSDISTTATVANATSPGTNWLLIAGGAMLASAGAVILYIWLHKK